MSESEIHTAIRYFPGAKRNPELHNVTARFARRDNAAFFAYVRGELEKLAGETASGTVRFDPGGRGAIVLAGEYGIVGHRLRNAQAVLRLDRAPSYWSHAALLTEALGAEPEGNRGPRSPLLWESSLEPSRTAAYFHWRNGTSARRLGEFARVRFSVTGPHGVPNAAVIAIALSEEEREAVLARAREPECDTLGYDLPSFLAAWYTYILRPGESNPLARGVPVPGAAYLQLAYEGAEIDLGVGAHGRALAPEHVWQLAARLHTLCTVADPETGEAVPRRVAGWFCVRDPAASLAPGRAALPRSLGDFSGP